MAGDKVKYMGLEGKTEGEKPRQLAKTLYSHPNWDRDDSEPDAFRRGLISMQTEERLQLSVLLATLFNNNAAIFRGGPNLRVRPAHVEQFMPAVPCTLTGIACIVLADDGSML